MRRRAVDRAKVAAADAALSRLIALPIAARGDPQIEPAIAEAHADPDRARQQQWVREEIVLSPFLRILQSDARWSSLLARTDTPEIPPRL